MWYQGRFLTLIHELRNGFHKAGIAFSTDMLKLTLHQLIKSKPRTVKYSADQILESAGHTPLRLRKYRADLNPTASVWATVKDCAASRHVSCNVEYVKNLCEENFKGTGKEGSLRLCECVKGI
jgi:transposase